MPPKRVLTIIISMLFLSACNLGQVRDADPGDQAKDVQTPSQPPEPIAVIPERPAKPNLWAIESEQETVSHDDVWARIRAGLTLSRELDQPAVRDRLAWYSRNQGYLDRIAERATPYLHHIVEEIEARGMPLELALLPIVESAYQPLAYSRMHASGLWQFIPATGRRFGLKQNWWYDGRRDVLQATRAALDYLDFLSNEFDGDWLHALAGYNAGERRVSRAIQANRAAGKPTSFWHLQMPAETRGYIPAMLAISEIVANPEQYGVSLQPIPNEPYFTTVDSGGQIDLDKAAKLAGIDTEEIKRLNPGFKRWATDPEGPHRLLVPIEHADRLAQGLRNLPPDQRLTWRQHRIQRGETLAQIAARYGTTVAVLQQTNNIRGHLIRAGRDLMIPTPGAEGEPPPAQLTAATGNASDSSSGDTRYHVVRNGDNLWQIARRHGYRVAQITAANGIRENAVLRPGQRLRLPGPGARDGGLTRTAATGSADESRRISYTVRSGDSLWTISRQFQVSVDALRKWNRLAHNSLLHPGQQLEVYVDSSTAPHGI